jgi:hypothetical protein
MFLSFLPCLFFRGDQNMGNNAITISFSFLCHGYAFVSSTISHGRISKSHNNVLSRPKMYLYTHFKEREEMKTSLMLYEKSKQLTSCAERERKSFFLFLESLFFSLVHEAP